MGRAAHVQLQRARGAGPPGLKLTGFAIWNRTDGGQNVTVPARPYMAHGEKKSFALLRPVADVTALEGVRTLIVGAYQAQAGGNGEPGE